METFLDICGQYTLVHISTDQIKFNVADIKAKCSFLSQHIVCVIEFLCNAVPRAS